MTVTLTRERRDEIAAEIREYTERHAQHLASNDGEYPFCGCNPYQDVIYGLAEYDPEDPRNTEIPIEQNKFVLSDGTVIEETGTGAWTIGGEIV